jgi:hypothetical protein
VLAANFVIDGSGYLGISLVERAGEKVFFHGVPGIVVSFERRIFVCRPPGHSAGLATYYSKQTGRDRLFPDA